MNDMLNRQLEGGLSVLREAGYAPAPSATKRLEYLAAVNPMVKALKHSLGGVSPAAVGAGSGNEVDVLHAACAKWLAKFGGE